MNKSNLNNKKIVITQYLPHNFLAEKMILSCLLISSEAIETTEEVLPIESFYFKNHQQIYRAIIFMHKNNIPIDIITLMAFLQDNGLLEKVGGVNVLIEIISQIPNLVYLDNYLALIKDKFIRRSLIKFGYEIINSSYITNLPLENILTELEVKLNTLATINNSKKVLSSAELLNNIFFKLKEQSLNPTISGISSGFNSLDSITQGFQKSDLIIIAGRPSMGKTSLGLNIASNIIKTSQLPVLFFSLEMSKEQIMYRLLAMEANINQTRLRSGKLYQDDWIKLNNMIKILAKLPFFIDDNFNLSIENIKSKIKDIISKQIDIGLIIIDYLQLMQSLSLKTENRVQELSQLTRSLKTIAREFNVPIIALSQLSRNVENRIDKKPILSDLRESGSIEQDADVVVLLYRNNSSNLMQYSNHIYQSIDLIIAKHRNGPTGVVKLEFDEEQTKFYDI